MSTTNTLQFLSDIFAPAKSISRSQFREFMGISSSTEWRVFKSGQYPRVIRVCGHDRILLTDFAEFLDRAPEARPSGKRNRFSGRPKLYKERTTKESPAEFLTTLDI